MSQTDNTVANLIKGAGEQKGKKPFAGWNVALAINLPGFTATLLGKYAKIEAQPLIDLEAGIQKLGPTGKSVESHWEKHFYEAGVEIQESQIKAMQLNPETGQMEEVGDLPRTESIDVGQRQFEDCTLDESNMKNSLGCLIPRDWVEKFEAENTNTMWGKGHFDKPFIQLAEYLETQKCAAFFPYTFGKDISARTVSSCCGATSLLGGSQR